MFAAAPPTSFSHSYRVLIDKQLTLAMQLLSLAAAFVALWSCTNSLRSIRFGLRVPPRSTECFYEQTTREDSHIDVGVQVLGGGNLDIRLKVYKSEKEEVLSELVTRDSKAFTIALSGDKEVYKICLENSFSLLAEKRVHFEFLVYDIHDKVESTSVAHHRLESAELTQVVADVDHGLTRLKWRLFNITGSQDYIRARRTRDGIAADAHSRRVLMWSILEVVAMVFASLIQIITVTRLSTMYRHTTGRT